MALVSSAGDFGIPALNECRGLSLDPRPGKGMGQGMMLRNGMEWLDEKRLSEPV
jgi:hypothetical protein